MSQGLHHLQKHPTKHHITLLKFFDKSMYIIALIPPVMTIPQLLTIWLQHKTLGVSLSTWAAYCFSSTLWFVYGLLHKDRPLTLTNFLLLALDGAIVVGVLLFH